MAIDRIGKGGGLPPTPELPGSGTEATPPTKTFEVERSDPAAPAEHAAGVDAAGGASPLARVQAGEIDVHTYIDLRVDEATSALKGLSSSELDEIKSVLRDQMRTDPGLADLVRTATGKMPTPPED